MKYSQFHDMRDSEKELRTSILLSFLAREPVLTTRQCEKTRHLVIAGRITLQEGREGGKVPGSDRGPLAHNPEQFFLEHF